MLQNFELVSKENELDIMKCEHFIESLICERGFHDIFAFEDGVNINPESLAGIGKLAFGTLDDYSKNKKMRKNDKVIDSDLDYRLKANSTKSRVLNGANVAMDVISAIVTKISELFNAIYQRVTLLIKDIKTTSSIKKLQFIIKNKTKFNQYIVDDARPKYVEKICDKFNIEVTKLAIKSNHMGTQTLEAKFEQLYKKTIDQLEKYMGEIPKSKKVPIGVASNNVLTQLEKSPDNVKKIKKVTEDFAKKVERLLKSNTEPEDKKTVLSRMANKVTEVNAKCTNFIATHPFVVVSTICAVAGLAGYVGGNRNSGQINKKNAKHDADAAFDAGYMAGRKSALDDL